MRGVFCARMPPPWVMVRWTKGGKRPQSSTTTSSTALTCAQQTDPGGFPSTKDEAHSQCVCRVETAVDGKKQRSTTNAAGEQLHVPSSLLPLDFEFREFRCFLQLEYQLACARREVLQQLVDLELKTPVNPAGMYYTYYKRTCPDMSRHVQRLLAGLL